MEPEFGRAETLLNESSGLKPKGGPELEKPKYEGISRQRNEQMKIGAWNARTMNTKGTLHNVLKEMKRNNLNVLGVSEVRWKEEGDFDSGDYRVIFSGGQESQRGVAIILDKELANRVVQIDTL